ARAARVRRRDRVALPADRRLGGRCEGSPPGDADDRALPPAVPRRAGVERARGRPLPAQSARPLRLARSRARRLQRRPDGSRQGGSGAHAGDGHVRRQREPALAHPQRLLVKIALLALLAAALAIPTAAPASRAAGCTTVKAPAPEPNGGHKAPKALLSPGHTYTAMFVTNCGSFTVTLAAKT